MQAQTNQSNRQATAASSLDMFFRETRKEKKSLQQSLVKYIMQVVYPNSV